MDATVHRSQPELSRRAFPAGGHSGASRRLAEAQSEVQAGLAINPACTISRFRANASIYEPFVVAEWEHYVDGLRKAGVREQ